MTCINSLSRSTFPAWMATSKSLTIICALMRSTSACKTPASSASRRASSVSRRSSRGATERNLASALNLVSNFASASWPIDVFSGGTSKFSACVMAYRSSSSIISCLASGGSFFRCEVFRPSSFSMWPMTARYASTRLNSVDLMRGARVESLSISLTTFLHSSVSRSLAAFRKLTMATPWILAMTLPTKRLSTRNRVPSLEQAAL
mmetsp:Transcript_96811/g.242856  ORF Transcript_96811/g.242856 Transcript_96811/m.242856 type:complete len:205 (-) Transcript_96811:319-933(-)